MNKPLIIIPFAAILCISYCLHPLYIQSLVWYNFDSDFSKTLQIKCLILVSKVSLNIRKLLTLQKSPPNKLLLQQNLILQNHHQWTIYLKSLSIKKTVYPSSDQAWKIQSYRLPIIPRKKMARRKLSTRWALSFLDHINSFWWKNNENKKKE